MEYTITESEGATEGDDSRSSMPESKYHHGRTKHRSKPSLIERVEAMSAHAQMYRDSEEYAKAATEQEKAVELAKKTKPEILINELTFLGVIYEEHHKFVNNSKVAKALKVYKQALTIAEKHYGPDHVRLISILDGLAGVYSHKGNGRKAVKLYNQALLLIRKAGGADSVDAAAIETDIAAIHFFRDEYQVAEELLRHAVGIITAAQDPGIRQLPCVLNNLALVVTAAGKQTEGLLLMEEAVRLESNISGPESPALIGRLQNLGGLYALAGKWKDAEHSYCRAIVISIARDERYPAELKELNRELKAVKSGKWTKQLDSFLHYELDRGYLTTDPNLNIE